MPDQHSPNGVYQTLPPAPELPQYQLVAPQYGTGAPGYSPAPPHAFVLPSQSSSKSASGTSTPQVRKKRGRPPKATSLSSKITTTLNISVNTSPLSGLPTAEFNSNQIVKRGAPDFFTPLMRIGSAKQKKRRKNSASSSVGSSPSVAKRAKSNTAAAIPTAAAAAPHMDNLLVTPLSSAINGSTFTPYHQINSRALDNISMITQSDQVHNPQMFNLHNSDVSYYNTPPSSTVKGHFPNYLSTPQFVGSARSPVFPTPSRTEERPQSQAPAFMVTSSTPTPNVHNQDPMNMSPNNNLLPPVSLIPSKMDFLEQQQQQQHHQQQQQQPQQQQQQQLHQDTQCQTPQSGEALKELPRKELPRKQRPQRTAKAQLVVPQTTKASTPPTSNYLLKLTIDDLGKAIFSSDFFASEPKEVSPTVEVSPHTKPLPAPVKAKAVSKAPTLKKEAKLPTVRPRLTHANSVIGIEAQYIQKEQKPQIHENVNPANGTPAALRRHNSDITGFTNTVQNSSLASISEQGNITQPPMPQTPKYDDNYLYTSTGFTPNTNLGFSLTPQFNSMMYSMMSINSPQVRKNNQEFLMNQEFFMGGQPPQQTQDFRFDQDNLTLQSHKPQVGPSNPSLTAGESTSTGAFNDGSINMTDLMNLGNSTNDYDSKNSAKPFQTPSSSAPLSNEDSGDARLALKKIIHVKRK
ncbi:uncharacterized protein CANTADRAFT_24917 [Suhomyces tanzawaensis NRRL Y-17324]|uniref:Uncharacterized protein n=1 Tax=Suhomyces tanzawaensis NRRL Y-17324 TaxID=984487 RepID=A0A1E4SSA6_9ASCO|nr:uncharacterized protein CANTADRAFT_24917 [Suhomyces tanzawaensis NRRL Y-17324]ODV82381.1 hypothetical protein CANTADRAFT_24917 [Suhomyces tanzawaensis NRRL Y-17324]